MGIGLPFRHTEGGEQNRLNPHLLKYCQTIINMMGAGHAVFIAEITDYEDFFHLSISARSGLRE